MPLTVKNLGKRPFEINLRGDVDYGEAHPTSSFTMHQATVTPEGEPGVRVIEKELPGSVAWAGGETKDGLSDAIADLPEFKRAVAARILRVLA